MELVQPDPATAAVSEGAIERLAEDGPMSGRPLVDRIKRSRHRNMKELRPASTGACEVRILFVFDRGGPRCCCWPETKPGSEPLVRAGDPGSRLRL